MPRFFRTAIFRLSAINGVVFAGCLLLLLVSSYVTATSVLRDQIRQRVQDEIEDLSFDIGEDGATTAVAKDIEERLKYSARPADYYLLADPVGRKVAGNVDSLPHSAGWMEMPLEAAATVPGNASPPDQDHQLWGIGTRLSDGSFLFVGHDAHLVLSVQRAMIESFGWSAGVAFLLAAGAGIAVSRGFLRRIDAINTTSRAISDGNLKERIPVRGASDEIDRLSANLNRLFDGNQALLESLKQVTTDIAHDLRTPLSRMRQGLEDARMHAGDGDTLQETLDGAIAEADQLLSTFSALLRIAQIESGSRKTGFRAFSLSDVFLRLSNAYSPVAEDQGRPFHARVDENVTYTGDADLILQMIANLLENAMRHTPARGAISMTLEESAPGAIAVISDAGPGIPASQREKVFERFVRLDSSRNTPGNGLGLALVNAIASLHGIHVSLEDNTPGLRVVIGFPRSLAMETVVPAAAE